MRKFFSVLLVIFLSLGFMMQDGYAKRFGGGKSFGTSKSMSNFSRPQSTATPQRNSMSNPWMNRLAGFALGGLLAYLLMGNGLASGILSWLLLAGVVFFVISLIRSKMQMAAQSNTYQAASASPLQSAPSRFMNRASSASSMDTPAEFNSNKFLEDAKAQFIRLQAAYDKKDFNQLRELTTPDVFAEIQYQLHERGDVENITEVVTLDAVLLDVATEQKSAFEESVTVASVRFSGLIREDFNKPAAAFNEIWHFQQDSKNSNWLVAGIQQN